MRAITAFVTTPDRRRLHAPVVVGPAPANHDVAIQVDESRRMQTMRGFGAALTDSSAFLLSRLPSAKRESALHDLFGTRAGGIGLSVIRVPMGASDFSSHGSYTYNDLPPGETDLTQARFSIKRDEA